MISSQAKEYFSPSSPSGKDIISFKLNKVGLIFKISGKFYFEFATDFKNFSVEQHQFAKQGLGFT